MENIVKALEVAHPHLRFTPGKQASWAPGDALVTFAKENSPEAIWALLHEVGHALLDHNTYTSDFELVQKETAAWNRATSIAREYRIEIAEDYMQNCLDTYRDWLHKRSTCPSCGTHGLQATQRLYTCLNCQNTWEVSAARFCRPYRLTNVLTIK